MLPACVYRGHSYAVWAPSKCRRHFATTSDPSGRSGEHLRAQAGADPNITNVREESPLQIARFRELV